MGTRRDIVDGIMIADPRVLVSSSFAVNDASATGSDYSEAGPRPGVAAPDDALSKLAPRISGAQAYDAEIVVAKAGHPAVVDGLELGYRKSGEASTKTRGWLSPAYLAGWNAPLWSDTLTYTLYDAAVIPSTGQVVLVAYLGSISTELSVEVWDPTDWTWTSGTGLDDATLSKYPPGLLCLPGSERLLLFQGTYIYYSDDVGTSWSIYSASSASLASKTRIRCAYLDGQIAVVATTGSGDWELFASEDLGTNLESVETVNSLTPSSDPMATIVATPSRLIFGYRRLSDNYPCVRVLNSARDLLSAADVVVIDSASCDDVELAAAPGGLVYAFVHINGVTAVHYSVDNGTTWTEIDNLADNLSAVDYPLNHKGVFSAGHVVLMHNWSANSGDEDDSIGAKICGGWSTIGEPAVSTLASRAGNASVGTWIPIELPTDNGWTGTGAATQTLVSPGELRIFAASTQRYYSTTWSGTSLATVVIQMRVETGGSLASMDVGASLVMANGTEEINVQIRATTTGFRVYDVVAGAALGSDVTIDMTDNSNLQIAIDIQRGDDLVYIWYRRPGSTEWTAGPSGTLSVDTGSPAATNELHWGVIASTTSESLFQLVTIGSMGLKDDISFNRELAGYPISTAPIPVPDLGAGSGSALAHISAVSGPGRASETFSVPARHDYGLANILPEVNPSPSVKWRSTDTTEQIITWDLGVESWIGDSIALVLKDCNFFQAALEYYDGATWQTAGTADLRLSGIANMATTGDAIRPTAGTGGFVAENELAGGTVLISLGGSVKARRIRSNTAGVFTGSSTTKQAEILFDGQDGTEAATSATNSVIAPSGVLVVHLSTAQRRRYWRVRIPAQTCADSYFEAGVILPMQIQPFGAESAWGGGMEWQPNATSSRSRAGTSRVVEQGKPAASWQLGFTDGMEEWQIRGSTDLDYVGASGGLPLAVAEDVALLLRGVLEKTKAGEYPVVAFTELPATGATIKDRSLWIYGRLSGSIRTAVQQGDFGDDAILRVESIRIDEIV